MKPKDRQDPSRRPASSGTVRAMKGAQPVLDVLNELLIADLTASDLYLHFAKLFEDRGYMGLAEHFAHESTHERQHVERLVERIFFLEGTPKMLERIPTTPPSGTKEIIQLSLGYELDVAKRLNAAIQLCDDHNDAGTRELLEVLLRETEEDHILWLEGQLDIINDVGMPNYLTAHMRGTAAPAG